ncbi:MAG: hypothetical protein WCX69_00455 [Candidatus Paceibacterota bacterium]
MDKKIILSAAAILILAGIGYWLYVSQKETENPITSAPPAKEKNMTEAEARAIAEESCIKGGAALSAGTYNENSKTWWFDANLNTTKPGCNPACVVSVETKTAEINWRCTGAIPPDSTQETTCTAASRQGDVCAEIYAPVCATVQIQCIKAPCDPIKQTFSNACVACHNPLVSGYVAGECEK